MAKLLIMKSDLELTDDANYKGFIFRDNGWEILWQTEEFDHTEYVPGVTLHGLGKEFDQWVDLRISLAQTEVNARLEANWEYALRIIEAERIYKEKGYWVEKLSEKRIDLDNQIADIKKKTDHVSSRINRLEKLWK